MYKAEVIKLKKLLDDEIWEMLAASGAYVAGGAITSIFCNTEVNDIDVYFPSQESLFRVLASVFNEYEYALYDRSSFTLKYSAITQRTILLSHNEQSVQFMNFKYFSSPQEIFNSFDFTVCMGAFDCATNEFVLHEDFLRHNSQRYLKFNPNTDFPIMSLLRVDKYSQKGYKISKAEMLRVVFRCMELDIKSWEEVKDHVGGMYGYDVSQAFDETQEFSLAEFGSQLSALAEKNIPLYEHNNVDQPDMNFYDIVEELFYDPEEFKDNMSNPCFQPDKYLYKCVDENWKSNYVSKRMAVDYQEGAIIEVPSSGLYFHSDPSHPYHRSNNWVEVEVISGNAAIRDDCHEKLLRHGSTIKVIRNFFYDCDVSDCEKWCSLKYSKIDKEEIETSKSTPSTDDEVPY